MNNRKRKFQSLPEAFQQLEDYKSRHGTTRGFFYIECDKNIRRTFYAAEYLGKGWLRQVVERKKEGKSPKTYYVRPPNKLGENEFSLIAGQKLLTDILDLQLEWPHLEINENTFTYVTGVIKNKKKFYGDASLHDLHSDHIDSNYLRHQPGDKLYNKEFFENYNKMNLTKNDKKIVGEAIVESMLLFFHTQYPPCLEVKHYLAIRNTRAYDKLRIFLFDHEPVEQVVKKFPTVTNLLYLLLSRVAGFFLRFLPTTTDLIKLLYFKGRRENQLSTYGINKGTDEQVNVKLLSLMKELKRLMDE